MIAQRKLAPPVPAARSAQPGAAAPAQLQAPAAVYDVPVPQDALTRRLARAVRERANALPSTALLQRTPADAARAIWGEGHRAIDALLLAAWLTDPAPANTTNGALYGVGAADFAAIDAALPAAQTWWQGIEALRTDTGRRSVSGGQLMTWLGKSVSGTRNSVRYGIGAAQLAEVNAAIAALIEAQNERVAAARRKLGVAQAEAPGVTITHHGVVVNLDADQLKHQPVGYAIGTRQTAGGTKWPTAPPPDAAFHRTTTLPVVGEWARQLVMKDGDDVITRQSQAFSDGNKYEGFCLQVDGVKHVFVHCYPG